MWYDLGRSYISPIGPSSGVAVRITDDALNVVAFFGLPEMEPGKPPIKWGATGFFVKYEGLVYLVTAQHCARDLEHVQFWLRTGSQKFKIDHAEWYRHPDHNIDVAVTPIMQADILNNISAFESEYFLTDAKRQEKDVGPGDLVYTVGLYNFHVGKEKNVPVVHTGHIAANPDPSEEVSIIDWEGGKDSIKEFPAYLISANSLSCLSGSPVFVRRYLRVNESGLPGDGFMAYGSIWLLGVWSGSWYGEPAKAFESSGPSKLPVGVGITVPAERIVEALNRDELKMQRAALTAEQRATLELYVLENNTEWPEGPMSSTARSSPPGAQTVFNAVAGPSGPIGPTGSLALTSGPMGTTQHTKVKSFASILNPIVESESAFGSEEGHKERFTALETSAVPKQEPDKKT